MQQYKEEKRKIQAAFILLNDEVWDERLTKLTKKEDENEGKKKTEDT